MIPATMRPVLCLFLLLATGCAGEGGLGEATLGADFHNAETLREDGAVLQEVEEAGPAARAGLRSGDLILSIDGRPVDGACALEREILSRYPGEKVKLVMRRGPESFEKELELVEARKLYEKACDAGRPSGCYLLATLHAKGLEHGRANELFQRACLDGSAAACAKLGGRLLQGITESADEAQILDLVTTACDGGSAEGCSYLAYLYATGERGVSEDDARALVLYEKACDGGDANACYNVGIHHEKGWGTRESPSSALTAYERACRLGNALGCTNAGFLNERGTGIRPDVMQAALAYRRACEGTLCDPGDPLGCFNLGVFYRDGMGVARNKVTAAELFTRSCDRGNALGCANLADLYATGDGVPGDRVKARELYQKACDGGHEGACSFVKEME
jgi:TPR repeat protein